MPTALADRPAQAGVHHPRPAARVPALDGLRGVAVLLVVAFHYTDCTLPLGWTGVDLFFVLSGFLLGGILIDHRDSPNLLRVFYLRRACRILPLYAVVVGLAFAAAKVPDSIPLACYATFTQNVAMAWQNTLGPPKLAATWSLAIEEQFYLLLPAVVLAVRPNRLPRVVAAFVAVAVLFRAGCVGWLGVGHLAPYVLLPGRWDALFLGVAAAVLHRAAPAGGARPLAVAAALLGAAVLCRYDVSPASVEFAVPGCTAVAAFYACVVLLAVRSPGVAACLSPAPLRYVGKVSYCVYLVNAGLFAAARGAFPSAPAAVMIPACFLATLAAAAASYRYFESPLVRLGHRVRYQPAR